MPYNLDMRLLWYRKDLIDKAGATVPTDWTSFEAACAELKKIGVYGYGTRSGAGAFTGFHALVVAHDQQRWRSVRRDQKPNCVTPENIEAIDWVLGLVKNGYVDPRSATYTSQNVYDQISAEQVRHGLGRRRRSRERQRDRGAAAPGRQPADAARAARRVRCTSRTTS